MRIAIFLLMMSVSSAFAQTQAEMNAEAGKSYQQADAELNKVYQQVKTEYQDDPEFLTALKGAQLAWIKFRDAEVKMMFPDRQPGYYGTALSMCVSGYMEELTRERIAKLRKWLEKSDNDGCSSSMK